MNRDSYDINYPARKTYMSCGYDFEAPYDVDLKPGEWITIDTGIRFDGFEVMTMMIGNLIVDNWYMMLTPRSGLSTRVGLRLRNTVGIIDQDYRDNILVTVTVDEPYSLKKGERFVQGIIMPYLVWSDECTPREERKGGYGSTGQ